MRSLSQVTGAASTGVAFTAAVFTLVACQGGAQLQTPADLLVEAVANDSTEQALRLLTDGVNPNTASSNGSLAINVAVAAGNVDLVRELIGSGANTALKDSTGRLAFDYAIGLESEEVAKLLVLDAVRSAGGGPRVMEWMRVAAGESVTNAPQWHEVLNGELLSLGLMYLAINDNGGMIRPLRRAREIPNRTGYHALAVASRWGMTNAVRALLAIDVHPGLVAGGAERFLPIDLARMGGHDQVVALLQNAGARVSK